MKVLRIFKFLAAILRLKVDTVVELELEDVKQLFLLKKESLLQNHQTMKHMDLELELVDMAAQ